MSKETEAVFAMNGPLGRGNKLYKVRKGQIALASAIANLATGKEYSHLVAEAGTGIGKTYAYLVPILTMLKRYKNINSELKTTDDYEADDYDDDTDEDKVPSRLPLFYIVTDSLALQDQILHKDIGNLTRALQIPVNAVCLKGFSNYICLDALNFYLLKLGYTLHVSDDAIEITKATINDLESAGLSTPDEVKHSDASSLSVLDFTMSKDATSTTTANTAKMQQDMKRIVTSLRTYFDDFRDITGELEEFKNLVFNNDRLSFPPQDYKQLVKVQLFCRRSKCPFYKNCFYNKVRDRAVNADIVVMNHALFCCLQKGNSLLQAKTARKVAYCVFDECHKLPDRVRDNFSEEVNLASIKDTLDLLGKTYKAIQNSIHKMPESVMSNTSYGADLVRSDQENLMDKCTNDCNDAFETLYSEGFSNRYTNDDYTFRDGVRELDISTVLQKTGLVKSEADFVDNLQLDRLVHFCYRATLTLSKVSAFVQQEIHTMQSIIDAMHGNVQGTQPNIIEVGKQLDSDFAIFKELGERIKEIGGFLKRWLPEMRRGQSFTEVDYYRWYTKTENKALTLTLSPYAPSKEFTEKVLNAEFFADTHFVFASATIKTERSSGTEIGAIEIDNYQGYDSFMHSLGLQQTNTKVLSAESPFDYHQHALLCVPRELRYNTSIVDKIAMIKRAIDATPGGIFILCTSYTAVDEFAKCLRKNRDFTKRKILSQTDSSNRTKLINDFKRAGSAILIGTKSFWEGVDVPGSALSMVVIDKLPFPQKTIELRAAQVQYLRDNNVFGADHLATIDDTRLPNIGYQVFSGVDIPATIIDLKQGIGRLLRSESDVGVVVIFADGLKQQNGKRYRQTIMQALPDYSYTENVQDLVDFWRKRA